MKKRMSIEKIKQMIAIKKMTKPDIPLMVYECAKADWPKPESLFQRYCQEQCCEERLIWLAYLDNQFTGYVTLKWKSPSLSNLHPNEEIS
jgi:hypothetical protein